MLPIDPQLAADRLLDLQRLVRAKVIESRSSDRAHEVTRDSAADTLYQIDTAIEPLLESFCEEWGQTTPLVLIAEGIEDEQGREGAKVYPRGTRQGDAPIRVIVDPIDGTRGIMYDKRSAWSLAGIAPNLGSPTRLRDIEVAAMTELPTSKMNQGDVLWAVRGRGAHGRRETLDDDTWTALPLRPSRAAGIDHGFASVANFFPGTKEMASALMEFIASRLSGPADVRRAAVFDDQYICTGGQFYELMIGHDRFIADLRPLFYSLQKQPPGLCCHPYDCAAMLIAEEAGVVLTDGQGHALDGPMDVTSGISWAGFANAALAAKIGPLICQFLNAHAR